LIEKYRAIFGWDVPDIDENLANRLILNEVRQALSGIKNVEIICLGRSRLYIS
jgi:hypothetical protein